MSGLEGVDYAWARPSPQALAAAGIRFVIRYLSHDPTKDLSAAELDALWEYDLGVGVVFESAARRALQGFSAGVEDGRFVRGRLARLGLETQPVYFACDFDAAPGDTAPAAAYLAGCASVLGRDRVGVYGSFALIEALAAGPARPAFAWQTYAWSAGNVSEAADLLQYRNGAAVAGVQVDLDRSLKPGFGVRFRSEPSELRSRSGYWAWVQWRLGEGDWRGFRRAQPGVRPDVPARVPRSWWLRLVVFLARRDDV